MDHQAQAVIRPGRLDAAARAAYAVVFGPKCDTSGGMVDMEACLDGAFLFDVLVRGEVVGRYALRQVNRKGGKAEVYVLAAVGELGGVSLVEAILPHVERQCAAADALTVHTRRRGLVKKLTAEGWSLDGYILRKKK